MNGLGYICFIKKMKTLKIKYGYFSDKYNSNRRGTQSFAKLTPGWRSPFHLIDGTNVAYFLLALGKYLVFLHSDGDCFNKCCQLPNPAVHKQNKGLLVDILTDLIIVAPCIIETNSTDNQLDAVIMVY
jgi:hypothetical protein